MSAFRDKRPFFGQDPFVVPHNDQFLLVQSAYNDTRIVIKQIETLDNFHGMSNTVWMDGKDSQLWAPELHNLDDKWYIYYASSDGDNKNHRMYSIESNSPLGPYHNKTRIFDPNNDFWAIDMTILTHNDERYAVWSGWEQECSGFPQHLYGAPLLEPNRIGTRSLLASPHFNWEKTIAPLLEGPQVLQTQEKLFLTYSANASWTNEYCVGLLEYTGGPILDPESWVKGPQPILKGGGHGCFIGNRYVHHRKLSALHGWADREIVATPYEIINGYPIVEEG